MTKILYGKYTIFLSSLSVNQGGVENKSSLDPDITHEPGVADLHFPSFFNNHIRHLCRAIHTGCSNILTHNTLDVVSHVRDRTRSTGQTDKAGAFSKYTFY